MGCLAASLGSTHAMAVAPIVNKNNVRRCQLSPGGQSHSWCLSLVSITPGPQRELKNSLKNKFNQETIRKTDLYLWSLVPLTYVLVYYDEADMTRKLLFETSTHKSKGASHIQHVIGLSRSFSLNRD